MKHEGSQTRLLRAEIIYVKRPSRFFTYGVDLVESFPLFVLDSQSLCGLDGPLHVARPHLQVADALPTHVGAQSAGKLTDKRKISLTTT